MKYLNHDEAEKKLATIKNFTAALDLIEFSIEKDEDSGLLVLSDTLDPSYGYNGEESFVDFKEAAEFISSIGFFEETVVQTLEKAIDNIVSEREEYSDRDAIPTDSDVRSITDGQSYAEGIAKVIEAYPTVEYYLREADYGGDVDMLRAVTTNRDMLADVRSFSTMLAMESEPLKDDAEGKIGVRVLLDNPVYNLYALKVAKGDYPLATVEDCTAPRYQKSNEVTLVFEPPIPERDEFVLNGITLKPIDEIEHGAVFSSTKDAELNKPFELHYVENTELKFDNRITQTESIQRALQQAYEVSKGCPVLTFDSGSDWLMNEVEDEKLTSFNAEISSFRADICEQLIQAAQSIDVTEPKFTQNGKEDVSHKGLSFEAKATLRGEAPDFDYYYDAYAEFTADGTLDNVMLSVDKDGEKEYATFPADKLPDGLADTIVEKFTEAVGKTPAEYAEQEQAELDKDNMNLD